MILLYKADISYNLKAFISKVLRRYDTSKLELMEFKKAKRLHGCCYYPSRSIKRKFYKIICWCPTKADNVGITSVLKWGEINTGRKGIVTYTKNAKLEKLKRYVKGGKIYMWHLSNINSEKQWPRVTYDIHELVQEEVMQMTFWNLSEELAWLFGHELFHFLRKTRQVGGKNTQNQADGFGINVALEWRKEVNGA